MQTVARQAQSIRIQHDDSVLTGELTIPPGAWGAVIFARIQKTDYDFQMAETLNKNGLATLVLDLLTPEEQTSTNLAVRFNVLLLSKRLMEASAWVKHHPQTAELPLAYFGVGTGAAAAMRASIFKPAWVKAVICRGGRPDLITPSLSEISVPTLLVVGETDDVVLDLNVQALDLLPADIPKELSVIAGRGKIFLEETASRCLNWLETWLK